ncbi:unnamed protein product [Cuscuta europaea]|uniref:Uncharacterized protein n=1 Tax=Cuscuta europaea TaxID=41803 RepID=A0A9P0ZMH9_CUSEU|nr:unnamed protein product [Cuscuta europaea]
MTLQGSHEILEKSSLRERKIKLLLILGKQFTSTSFDFLLVFLCWSDCYVGCVFVLIMSDSEVWAMCFGVFETPKRIQTAYAKGMTDSPGEPRSVEPAKEPLGAAEKGDTADSKLWPSMVECDESGGRDGMIGFIGDHMKIGGTQLPNVSGRTMEIADELKKVRATSRSASSLGQRIGGLDSSRRRNHGRRCHGGR